MPSRKKLWIALVTLPGLVLALFLAWQSNQERQRVVGGYCKYDTTRVGAKVLTVSFYKRGIAADSVVITAAILNNGHADTIDVASYEYGMYNQYDWEKVKIKEGDTLACIFSRRIVGGACPPFLYHFVLENKY